MAIASMRIFLGFPTIKEEWDRKRKECSVLPLLIIRAVELFIAGWLLYIRSWHVKISLQRFTCC